MDECSLSARCGYDENPKLCFCFRTNSPNSCFLVSEFRFPSSLSSAIFFVPAEQVGEGAFGEVFLLAIDSAPVLKIVAVDGSAPVNGQPQTKLSDMLAEIIITSELSKLRNTTKNCRAENFVEVLLSYVFFCSQSWRSWVLSKHVKL